jgi:hypothetical protein
VKAFYLLRYTLVVLLLLVCADLSRAADIVAHKLVRTSAVHDRICREAAQILSTDRACRPFDAVRCSDEEAPAVTIRGQPPVAFAEVATNQYG